MKLIETYKSPNFNERRDEANVKYIILHYTAMTNHLESLNHMCSKNNQVSSHFLINKKGDIHYLVDINKRAWHAGKSFWNGSTDLNSSSIGIEIDNSGHFLNFESFTRLQIKSLIYLINHIAKDYKICLHNILGHSDIAPYRKIDPGEKFPWNQLNRNRLSYLPKLNIKKHIKNEKKIKSNIISPNLKEKVLFMLKNIGYDTREVKKNSKKFNQLIKAYQRHYRQSIISGEADYQTYELIKQHYKDVLTL